MKNEKKTVWGFFYKYGKFWCVSPEQQVGHKPFFFWRVENKLCFLYSTLYLFSILRQMYTHGEEK